jgi:hypothetical protein
MKKINIDELLFRSHSQGDLMGVKGLGETGQKKAVETYIQACTNRRKASIKSKYLEKGILLEPQSVELIKDMTGNEYQKNNVRMMDKFHEGECDIYAPEDNLVLDIKNSWDIHTFWEMIVSKNDNAKYEWQGRVYMKLYNVSNFSLVYTLLSSPIMQVNKAIEKEKYYNGGVISDFKMVEIANDMIFEKELFEEWFEQANFFNFESDDRAKRKFEDFVSIPIEKRIHIKSYSREEDKETLMNNRVLDARDYLKNIFK